MMMGFVLVAVVFWATIGFVFVVNGYFVYQVRMARYRVMQTLADKGQPVPLELFSGPRRAAPVGMTRGGIVMVATGISLMMFFWSMTAQSIFHGPIESAAWLPTIGFLPFMIGVALLVMALIERRQPQ